MECQRNPDTQGDTNSTPACYESSRLLRDQLNTDTCPASNLASCLRRESTMAGTRSYTQRENASVIATPSSFTKDSVSLFPALSWRTKVTGTAAAHHNDHDSTRMSPVLDYPLLSEAFRSGAPGVPPMLPLEEECKNAVTQAAVLPQPSSTPILPPPIETSHPTLQKVCVVSSPANTWQGVAVKDMLSFSSSSLMSAAPSQLNPLHGAGLIRCHSAPALHKVANRTKVLVHRSLPEEEVSRPRSAVVQIAAIAVTSPRAHHGDESFSAQPPHGATITSRSGPRASCLRASTSVSGPVLEEVAAVALTGVGSREFSFRSPSSSIVTFIDHELDISTTDSGVLHAGDGLHDASEAESLLESEGGRRCSGTKLYLLTDTRSSLVSGAHVRPFMSRSTVRHRRLPAAVTSVPQPAHLTSEYAAAVQAAAKHGRSLRQILARCGDADDALRDSGEAQSEL
ncbi:hypothetical protein LMJF_32_1965 [Leishmania major strain Friedlin]|uniref:Uncharacterized protein n=1 Tax=Leishmania major TaxID=5664 RepID=Q4Q581_LEIMA|nr:hypothetical protein LMJF_32_1965 [Leishmania major strain Friedlin]CAG9580328.1 hypothetical_protein_-_conserved [Leishmania major strain Friedlin]CAJ08721.1 hypothetical protein LMJF_32_1965 [Leishmania major strain Friedlin]|eukprot:XP_001685517.1 hypothetical protein LMJF_32_1965 [Leishmania major strain Friedlin]